MNKSKITTTIVFAIFIISTGIMVTSHVPIDAEGNNGLDTAQVVNNPTKSWAIYSVLENEQDVSYFKFDIAEGKKIYIQLFVTTREDELNFVPKFALMGPSLGSTDAVPSYVETTSDVIVAEGERSEPSYESFGPSHFIEITKLELEAPVTGTFYVAVFSETSAGHFGLAIGIQESFTFLETVMNPINVIEVYLWQGESWFFILIPYVLTFAIGGSIFNRLIEEPTKEQWGIYLLGLLFLSSSVSFSLQMIYNVYMSHLGSEVIISLVIIALQAAVASGVITLGKYTSIQGNTSAQIRLLLLSVVSLFIWVGMVIGPVIGILISISLIFKEKLA